MKLYWTSWYSDQYFPKCPHQIFCTGQRGSDEDTEWIYCALFAAEDEERVWDEVFFYHLLYSERFIEEVDNLEGGDRFPDLKANILE
jgi:hypothetical protein